MEQASIICLHLHLLEFEGVPMLYGLLIGLFSILCILLILIILVQKGKSSMGLGSLGGGTQLLFGGSGGQDLFQKTTWVMAALFMGGSLGLAMLKKPSSSNLLGALAQSQAAEIPVMPSKPAESKPAEPAN